MKPAEPNGMSLANPSQMSINDDVLHIPNTSKLTPEEIAKALAHHNKHHSKEHKTQASASAGKNLK